MCFVSCEWFWGLGYHDERHAMWMKNQATRKHRTAPHRTAAARELFQVLLFPAAFIFSNEDSWFVNAVTLTLWFMIVYYCCFGGGASTGRLHHFRALC